MKFAFRHAILLLLLLVTARDCAAVNCQGPLLQDALLPLQVDEMRQSQTNAGQSNPQGSFGSPLIESELEVSIGDITTVAGEQTNQIWGHGLVTGLQGTGAKDEGTQQELLNYALRIGIPIGQAETKNTCFVTLTGDLPEYPKIGEKFQIHVSAVGDATSLRGGTLINAELRAFDGEVYATVQGQLSVPGFSASGAGASVQKNHNTVATCMAQVVKEICVPDKSPSTSIKLNLRNKDHLTASRITSAINNVFPGSAHAIDKGTVEIQVPVAFLNEQTAFIGNLLQLKVRPFTPARVVINQRSGTIVMGHNVRISKVVFANENLVITTAENPIASQPAPFSNGETVVLPRTELRAFSENGRFNVLNSNVTVGEFAAALNALGIAPTDLINIFQAIDRQGGLHAELIID